MDNNYNRILQLLEKYNNSTASVDELEELDRWYQSFGQEEKLSDLLPAAELKKVEQRLLKNVIHRLGTIGQRQATASRSLIHRKWLPLTALSLACFLIIFIFVIRKSDFFHEQNVKVDALPGGNKAILILGNGKRIDLSAAKTGAIAHIAGVNINKSNHSTLTYQSDGTHSAAGNSTGKINNTIITPRGGQYEVRLPDGTRIWLNSGSSLTYPVHFSSSERTVWLTGEGYFEVAKDKSKPFHVISETQQVQVLGTHFNVNAYPDENIQKTTLLEGSVKVVSKTNSLVIRPGEQAINKEGGLNTRHLNADDAIVWKNGLFHFDHTELHELMRELSRWYDVDVVYEGKSRERFFSGTIDKTYTLSEVLKVLELGKINYRIELSAAGLLQNRRLIIRS